MAATHRPRHIRDIAHLYLSRRPAGDQMPNPTGDRSPRPAGDRSGKPGDDPSHRAAGDRMPDPTGDRSPRPAADRKPVLNLFVCAGNRDCLSGFHASNIAAGMSARKAAVRVFELSGLLPNVAYYLSHQPGVYLKPLVGLGRDFLPGLGGVTITFDSMRLGAERSPGDGLHINLVHLPTLENDLVELLSTLRDRCVGERWVIYLTRHVGQPKETLFRDRLGASETFTVLLPGRGESCELPAAPGRSLGAIRGWEARVEDRVPVVLRNRDSRLARDYLALCESVLVQINSLRRRQEIGKREWPSRLRAARR